MNPTQGVLEGRINSLEGGVHHGDRPARHARRRLGPGGGDVGHPHAGRGRRPHRVVVVALRRHVQPVPLHAAEARHRGQRSSTTPTTSSSGERRSRPNTKAFFGETIANPKNDVFDIEGVAGVAHEAGVPLIIDNTVPSPYLIRPLEWGADIVVHSLTKFLGGHGNSIGGAIIDGGTFDFGASRPLPRLHRARPELPRPRLLAGARPRGVHPQGSRPAAARHRRADLAVQRLPHPAGHRDAQPAHGAPLRQRPGRGRVPRPGRVRCCR